MKIESGNAAVEGAASHGWFVGDLAAWAAQRGEVLDASSTPRQTAQLEVKWLVHPPHDRRASWAEPDRCYTVSVLVAGEMRLDFRSVDGAAHAVELSRPGDYVAWSGAECAHTWHTLSGCTMLTIRWPVDSTAAGP
jgi:hypothetical protein